MHYPSCRTTRCSSFCVSMLSAVHYSRENINKRHLGRSRHPTAIRQTFLSKVVVGLLGLVLALAGVGAEVVIPSSSLAPSEVSGSRQRLHQAMALDSPIAFKTQQKSNALVGSALSHHRHSLETYKSDSTKNKEAVIVDETDDDYGETTQDYDEDYDTTTEEDVSSDDPAPLTSSQREGTEDGVELEDPPDSVRVCVVTWNLAEVSPPARDVEFIRRVSRESDIVAVGVQEIENLKPRRHEGGRTREWRRLLIRLCLQAHFNQSLISTVLEWSPIHVHDMAWSQADGIRQP